MRYVLDSNIGLEWVLTEADSDKARRLRSEYQNQVHELLAPDVFPVEVAHALAKAERRGIIDTPRSSPPRFDRVLYANGVAQQSPGSPQAHPGNVESPPSSGFPLLRRTPTGFPQPDAPVRLGRKFPTQGAPAANLGFALNAFGVRVAAESRSSVHEPSGVRREVSNYSPGGRGPAVDERPLDATITAYISALAQEGTRHRLPGTHRSL